MQGIPSAILDTTGFSKHYLTLTSEQQHFANLLLDWIKNPRKMLIILSGGPGTGKTYAVINTLSFVRRKQLRMAYTGRSSHAIGGHTIHSAVRLDWTSESVFEKLETELENEMDVNMSIKKSHDIINEFHYTEDPPDIIVVDEINTINGWMMYWLIRYFMDKRCILFIVMGDPNQLRPVRSKHNLFSITSLNKLYEIRYINLMENKRFTPKYQVLIRHLRSFVESNNKDGLSTFLRTHFPVVKNIDSSVLKQATRAMAFRNSTVDTYNEFYISELPGTPCELDSLQIGARKIKCSLKINCLIFVTENGCGGATNGAQLVFKGYNESNRVLECVDNDEKSVLVHRSSRGGYFPIDVGFASTVHKYQRETIDSDKIVINFDESQDLNLAYTALSRVRDLKQILAIKL